MFSLVLFVLSWIRLHLRRGHFLSGLIKAHPTPPCIIPALFSHSQRYLCLPHLSYSNLVACRQGLIVVFNRSINKNGRIDKGSLGETSLEMGWTVSARGSRPRWQNGWWDPLQPCTNEKPHSFLLPFYRDNTRKHDNMRPKIIFGGKVYFFMVCLH